MQKALQLLLQKQTGRPGEGHQRGLRLGCSPGPGRVSVESPSLEFVLPHKTDVIVRRGPSARR